MLSGLGRATGVSLHRRVLGVLGLGNPGQGLQGPMDLQALALPMPHLLIWHTVYISDSVFVCITYSGL